MSILQLSKHMPLRSTIDVYQFEFTLASLRYSLGELRPKETTNHTMSLLTIK